MILNAFPVVPIKRVVNNRTAHSEPIRKRLECNHPSPVGVSDFLNLLGCKLGMTSPHAKSVPLFRNTVPPVLRIGAKEKVIRPNARWVVAPMKHLQSFWDGSVRDNPRCSVGSEVVAQSVAFNSHNRSVSLPGESPSPKPTRFRFSYLGPKALRECFRKPLRGEVLLGNFNAHNQVSFGCDTPPAASTARGALNHSIKLTGGNQ